MSGSPSRQNFCRDSLKACHKRDASDTELDAGNGEEGQQGVGEVSCCASSSPLESSPWSPALLPPTARTSLARGSPSSRSTGRRVTASNRSWSTSTGGPVELADKARGYEVGRGDYVLVEDDELKAVAIESQYFDRFVPRAQIDNRYFAPAKTPLP